MIVSFSLMIYINHSLTS